METERTARLAATVGMARPPEVQRSAWLWIAAILLRVASLVAVYVAAGSITRRAAEMPLFRAPHLVFVAVTTVLALALVMTMRRGRNWARITLTVGGVLNAVGLVVGLVFVLVYPIPENVTLTLGGPVGVAFDVAETLCIVAALVLFYRPRANAYFAAGRRR